MDRNLLLSLKERLRAHRRAVSAFSQTKAQASEQSNRQMEKSWDLLRRTTRQLEACAWLRPGDAAGLPHSSAQEAFARRIRPKPCAPAWQPAATKAPTPARERRVQLLPARTSGSCARASQAIGRVGDLPSE